MTKVSWTKLSKKEMVDGINFDHGVKVDGKLVFFFHREYDGEGFYARLVPEVKGGLTDLIVARVEGTYRLVSDIKANAERVALYVDGQPIGGLHSFLAAYDRFPGQHF